MGLNPRGRGRGRGNKTNFQIKGRRGGGLMGQGPMLRPGPPGMFCPSVRFPPDISFGTPPFFQGPSGFNFGPKRPFGKFSRKNYRKNITQRSNDKPLPEIDLTKPWVTEEIKTKENIKQELLQIWRKTKTNEDWDKYKAQKLSVQSLYEKAKAEYAASHQDEVAVWENTLTTKNYYCETCDKSFRTDDDLILHEAEHETCGREGCEFTAHPKIIAKHVKMQHLSGLYKRIGKLYGEEDIAKWIEERKKRYPTRKVVEEKKILELEKHNRGERIKNNESRFNESFRGRNRSSGRKKNFEKRIQKHRRTKKKKKSSVVQNSLEEEKYSDCRKGVPAFLGIKNGNESEISVMKDFDISDEEWEIECLPPNIETPKPLLNSSLRLLATVYDSDEENQNIEPDKEAKIADVSVDEGSGPEEVKTVICRKPIPEEKSNEKKLSFKKKGPREKDNREEKIKNYGDGNTEKRNLTLLEKLLKNEIRHERNVILQCIHFIVKNNFFKA